VQSLLGIVGGNEIQIIKQPDVIMLLYLLPGEVEPAAARTNYDYYTVRTDLTFGSSLGPSIQAIMAARLGSPEQAYENFMRAAQVDLKDVRGNSGDGIHGASAGGLWQAVVFGFGGLQVSEDGWKVNPRLPAHWKRLAFRFVWRGEEVSINLKGDQERGV
jgi:kojibiose phosphorylase